MGRGRHGQSREAILRDRERRLRALAKRQRRRSRLRNGQAINVTNT